MFQCFLELLIAEQLGLVWFLFYSKYFFFLRPLNVFNFSDILINILPGYIHGRISFFIECDFSQGQEKMFSITFSLVCSILLKKNELSLYWSFKFGFYISIIPINFFILFLYILGEFIKYIFNITDLILGSIYLASPPCRYLNAFWCLIILVLLISLFISFCFLFSQAVLLL